MRLIEGIAIFGGGLFLWFWIPSRKLSAKQVFVIVAVSAGIVLAAIGLANNSPDRGANKAAADEPSMPNKAFHDFAAKYNAVDYDTLFTNQGSDTLYTIDIQEALLNAGRPIAFQGLLQDIWMEHGTIFASVYIIGPDSAASVLRVTCSPQQRALLERTGNATIVAKVSKVFKPPYLNQSKSDNDTNTEPENMDEPGSCEILGACVAVQE